MTILFRFLTTAERGREQGSPFGTTCGLDYWDHCKRQGVDLHPLRTFLQSQQALPDTLHEFIASSDDVAFRSHLIMRIDWDTGSESKEYIEGLVNTRGDIRSDSPYPRDLTDIEQVQKAKSPFILH